MNETGYAFNLNEGKSPDGATVVRIVVLQLVLLFKKTMNASRPSEYPPVRGKNVKTFRYDHRLHIQNLCLTENLNAPRPCCISD